MGEAKVSSSEPEFNRSVKVEFEDQRLSSNAGVLLLRQADHKLQLIESIVKNMRDPSQQHLIRYQLGDLVRERVYAMAVGYSAQDDVDRLTHDPAFRMAVWNRAGDAVLNERLASQPPQSRLLGIIAGQRANTNALREGLFQCVHRHVLARGEDQRVCMGGLI